MKRNDLGIPAPLVIVREPCGKPPAAGTSFAFETMQDLVLRFEQKPLLARPLRIEHDNVFNQASRPAGNSLSAGSGKCDAFELFSF